MKILHILRSEPDEMTRNLIQQSFEDEEIFASDKVICWW
jgi:hypothetical protein